MLYGIKILCFAALFPAFTAFSQISPGDLTKSHARLEGMSNCTKCHTLGKQVENTRCLDCHTEIRALQSKGRGYHSSPEVKSKKCVACHSEHHGRDFQIVRFNPKKFDHAKTGYELTGKHKEAQCKECHQQSNIPVQISKRKSNTYLGLTQQCANCHTDAHAGKMGTDCAGCHTMDGFKPAPLFNHAKTRFRLTGAHAQIECAKCHPAETKNGKTIRTFAALPFANCTPCHKDKHNGKFDFQCAKCHSTESFRSVNLTSFNHAKTNFPLAGKHVSVACEACHGKERTSKPKYAACTDCHKDYHNGQFMTIDRKPADCAVCHTVQGFRPSLFGIEEHGRLAFRLEGSHLAVPCANCHFKESSWKFKPLRKNCVSCHENIHGDEISREFIGEEECTECHGTEKWNTVRFDHARTTFALTGVHAKIPCAKCHNKKSPVTGKRLFRSLPVACAGCHTDIHRKQFDDGTAQYCLRCHSTEGWKPVTFNHETTRFPLRGAHENVPCEKCHKPAVSTGGAYVLYKGKDFTCAACHS